MKLTQICSTVDKICINAGDSTIFESGKSEVVFELTWARGDAQCSAYFNAADLLSLRELLARAPGLPL